MSIAVLNYIVDTDETVAEIFDWQTNNVNFVFQRQNVISINLYRILSIKKKKKKNYTCHVYRPKKSLVSIDVAKRDLKSLSKGSSELHFNLHMHQCVSLSYHS